jgi:hypothetical protein
VRAQGCGAFRAREEFVIRRIPPDGFDATALEGQRILPSMIPSFDFKPSDDSYGLSVYVESLLADGTDTLGNVDPKWLTYGIVRIRAGDLRQFNVRVCYSPHDCDHEDENLKAAHASIIGIET